MARTPAYTLKDLEAACADPSRIFVAANAQKDADAVFGLKTRQQVAAFIAGGGLEVPKHAATDPWRKNPDPKTTILVDSYDFYSGTRHGYIAFFHNPKTGKWVIKSLKQNLRAGSRCLGFSLADKLSGFALTAEKDDGDPDEQ